MARKEDKIKAISLRLKGQSYSQIKSKIKISKSTLSNWLQDYPLSEKRIRELRDLNPQRIERYRATRALQKKTRLDEIYAKEKKALLPFSKRDLFIAGLFLYWGEGGKTANAQLTLTNTKPSIIKFFIFWADKVLKINKKDIVFRLHIFKDMSPEKEIFAWSKELKVSKNQFRKCFVKKTLSSSVTYKRSFRHGTCDAIIRGARLAEKVLMSLKAIEDSFRN